jgi:hypothetical protein
MLLHKQGDFIAFDIYELLGVSKENFVIEDYTQKIPDENGFLVIANDTGRIQLKTKPAPRSFGDNRETKVSTYNFDANVDLLTCIIRPKKTADTQSDPTIVTLNVSLTSLQNPSDTVLKPRLKFIVEKANLQDMLLL